MKPVEFKSLCDQICTRLAEDQFDPEAFRMLRSSAFVFGCAWMGLDPEFASDRITSIAAQRRGKQLAGRRTSGETPRRN